MQDSLCVSANQSTFKNDKSVSNSCRLCCVGINDQHMTTYMHNSLICDDTKILFTYKEIGYFHKTAKILANCQKSTMLKMKHNGLNAIVQPSNTLRSTSKEETHAKKQLKHIKKMQRMGK